MSFEETRLEDCVAYGFQAVPTYSTRIVTLDNGREVRNVNWTRAKRKYSALYQNFSPANFALLLRCFHAVRGSAHSFRFKDWTDFEATLEPLGTTPGADQTPVQLIKTYTFGSLSIARSIVKPVAAVVYQNGVPKAGSLATSTGLFTPTTNWTASATLTWTGTFDVPVRFASDEMPSAYENLNAISTTAELIEDFL